MSNKPRSYIDQEKNRVVREEGTQFWDQYSTERYYLQDHVGESITVSLMNSDVPITGTFVELGLFDVVLRDKSGTIILLKKHAIEAIFLKGNGK